MRLLISVLVFACVALAGVAASADECSCDDSYGTLQFAGWGVVLNKGLSKKSQREFMVMKPLTVMMDLRESARSTIELQPPDGCTLEFEKGDLVFVRAFGTPVSRYHNTAACFGTRRLGSPPPVSLTADAPIPLKSHPLLDDARALFRDALTQCGAGEAEKVESIEITLVPGDDPRVSGASECVGNVIAGGTGDWIVRAPVSVTGVLVHGEHRTSGAEMWECKDDRTCESNADIAIRALLEAQVTPSPEDAEAVAYADVKTRLDSAVAAAGLICPGQGYEAASRFADEHKLMGGQRYEEQLREAMLKCAIERRDIPHVRQYLAGAPLMRVVSDAFAWEAENLRSSDGDGRPPLRKGPAEPIGELSTRDFRHDLSQLPGWAHDLGLVEAFAHSVAAEPDSRKRTRFVGALAYHKAALLNPDPKAGEQYRKWADALDPSVATSDELRTMTLARTRAVAELAERLAQAREGTAPSEEEEVESVPVSEEPPSGEAAAPVTQEPSKPGWQAIVEVVLALAGGVGFGFLAARRRR